MREEIRAISFRIFLDSLDGPRLVKLLSQFFDEVRVISPEQFIHASDFRGGVEYSRCSLSVELVAIFVTCAGP